MYYIISNENIDSIRLDMITNARFLYNLTKENITKALNGLINMTILDCSDCENLDYLPFCKKLLELNCSNSFIRFISYLPNLVSLNCSECYYLQHISHLPNLTNLVCYHNKNLLSIVSLPKVTDISCYSSNKLKYIYDISNLKYLNCKGCVELMTIDCKVDRLLCDDCPKLKTKNTNICYLIYTFLIVILSILASYS
jgi:hypothetical protein